MSTLKIKFDKSVYYTYYKYTGDIRVIIIDIEATLFNRRGDDEHMFTFVKRFARE